MLTNIFFFKLKNQENQNRSLIVKFKVETAQTTQSADDQLGGSRLNRETVLQGSKPQKNYY